MAPSRCAPACWRRGYVRSLGDHERPCWLKGEWGRASPSACALPELSQPGVQLLLVPHLKDDVSPLLHLAGEGNHCVGRRRSSAGPGLPCSVTHLEHEGVEVIRHLQARAPPHILDAGAGGLQLGLGALGDQEGHSGQSPVELSLQHTAATLPPQKAAPCFQIGTGSTRPPLHQDTCWGLLALKPPAGNE